MVDLVEFIKANPACDKWVCTTCGGLFRFGRDLDLFLRSTSPLDRQLLDLRPTDDDDLEHYGHLIEFLLSRLDHEARTGVLLAWAERVAHEEAFALCLFNWFRNREMPRPLISPVIEGLEPVALRDRSLRNKLALRFPAEVRGSSRLQDAFAQDREHDRIAAEEEELAAQEEKLRFRAVEEARRKEAHGLAKMRPVDRFRQILSSPNTVLSEFPDAVLKANREELVDLSYDEIEQLIRAVGWSVTPNSGGALGYLLGNLIEVRFVKRRDEMDKLRRELDDIPITTSLEQLLSDNSIPLEFFPVEFANQIDAAAVEGLTVEKRAKLISMLSQTHLRRWRRLGRRLGYLQ
jgi:hypothetical protein